MPDTWRQTASMDHTQGGVVQPTLAMLDPLAREYTSKIVTQAHLSAGAVATAIVLPATVRGVYVVTDKDTELVITAGAAATVQARKPTGATQESKIGISLPFEGITVLTLRNLHATLDATAEVYAFGG